LSRGQKFKAEASGTVPRRNLCTKNWPPQKKAASSI
jgi:hypothetical protein